MQVTAAAEMLETAAMNATEAGVSAKYAKKVLKRLQRQLDSILAPEAPPAAPAQPESAPSKAQVPAAEQQPQAEHSQANGRLGHEAAPVSQPSERPAASGRHAAQNGIIQQHARAEPKVQVYMNQPRVMPPTVRKAPPPGFMSSQQQPQQPPQGKQPWPPVHGQGPSEPVAVQRRPGPLQPPAHAVPSARQAPRPQAGNHFAHAPAAVPASPRVGPPPAPPGFSSKLPAPEKRSSVQPPGGFIQPPPPPPPPVVPPAHGAPMHPASSPWPQNPSAGQHSLFSQQPMDAAAMMPGPFMQQQAMPPRAQNAVQQRGSLPGHPGTPRGWQGGVGAAGAQPPLAFGRVSLEQMDGAPIQDGSRRQSLENAMPGSLASHASTGCASEAGSMANMPRTTLADTSSSLFAHAPFPASPSHALAASAAQASASQPVAAYPGATRLSGQATSLFSSDPVEVGPVQSKAAPDVASMPGMQLAGLPCPSGSLQLTPSHFGTNVSANTGQGVQPTLCFANMPAATDMLEASCNDSRIASLEGTQLAVTAVLPVCAGGWLPWS